MKMGFGKSQHMLFNPVLKVGREAAFYTSCKVSSPNRHPY
jgi:hypothetical protein